MSYEATENKPSSGGLENENGASRRWFTITIVIATVETAVVISKKKGRKKNTPLVGVSLGPIVLINRRPTIGIREMINCERAVSHRNKINPLALAK